MLLDEVTDSKRLDVFLDNLPQIDQRKTLFSILKLLSEEHLDRLNRCESEGSKQVVAAVARAISLFISGAEIRKAHLVEWLTGSI